MNACVAKGTEERSKYAAAGLKKHETPRLVGFMEAETRGCAEADDRSSSEIGSTAELCCDFEGFADNRACELTCLCLVFCNLNSVDHDVSI